MITSRKDWIGAEPVFLMVLNWNGRTFRASTKPIQVSSNSGVLSFAGGLVEEPSINFQLPELGFQIDSYNTPISVYLNNIDISKQASKHNYMDDSFVELSFVLQKNENVSTFEERIQLISGVVKQPIYGHKEKSVGYVEFSIENPLNESSMYQMISGSGAVLSSLELSSKLNTAISPLTSIFKSGTSLIEVSDVHKGKNIPFIIGQCGSFIDEFETVKYFGATPAYVIFATFGASNNIWLAIASHDVTATTVRVYDDIGNFRTETVEKFTRRDGRVFCFVKFTHPTGGFQNPVEDESSRYFISWMNGGGFKSPLTNEPISNGGDLCLYLLQISNQEVDFDSWIAIRSLLNSYRFSGYISNFELSPLEFLENEIVPFLPISIIQSNEGLKPVYNVLASGASLLAFEKIEANEEFVMNGGIQTIDDVSQIINDYTLEYVYDPKLSEYRKSIRITGESKDLYQDVTSNQMCVDSFQRYGLKSIIESSNYIYDEDTAALIAFDKIKFKSQPSKVVTYITSSRYGYLNIGDIIELTDQSASLDRNIMQVISKTYESQNWSYTFQIAPEGKQK